MYICPPHTRTNIIDPCGSGGVAQQQQHCFIRQLKHSVGTKDDFLTHRWLRGFRCFCAGSVATDLDNIAIQSVWKSIGRSPTLEQKPRARFVWEWDSTECSVHNVIVRYARVQPIQVESKIHSARERAAGFMNETRVHAFNADIFLPVGCVCVHSCVCVFVY